MTQPSIEMNAQAERRTVRVGVHKTHHIDIYYYVEQTSQGRTIQLTDSRHGGPRSHIFPSTILPCHITYNADIESLFNSTLIEFYDRGKFFLGTSIPLSTASIDVDLVKNHDPVKLLEIFFLENKRHCGPGGEFMRMIESAFFVMGWRINLVDATQARLDFEGGKVGSPIMSPAWYNSLPVKVDGGKSESVDKLVGHQWLDRDGNLCLRYTPVLHPQAQHQQRMMNVDGQRNRNQLHIQANGSFNPQQRVLEQPKHPQMECTHNRGVETGFQQGPQPRMMNAENKRKIDSPQNETLPSRRIEHSHYPEIGNPESSSASQTPKKLKTNHLPSISPKPKQEKRKSAGTVGFVDLTD